jgi:hypothetical protein
MKYKISFQGSDTEVLISESREKMYNHFKDNGLDVTDHMCSNMEDELSEEITDGVCEDSKFECDRLYHNCGPVMNGSVWMHINKSDTDEEVYSCDLDEWEGEVDCERDVCFLDSDTRYIMVGEIYSKGYASEYILELKDDEEFDKSKLTLLYHDIDENYQIITGVQYNNIDLECTGEMSTKGNGESWYIMDTETRETTLY